MIQKIKKQLKELDFSENEIKVYVALTQLGESSARLIAKKAELPRTTAISILGGLEKDKFISTHKTRGKTNYWIESPQVLKEHFQCKVGIADDLNKILTDLYRVQADFPYAKIYDTREGIKSFIEKSIYELNKNEEILTIDYPVDSNYQRILSKEFIIIMVGLKKGKNIFTRTLVPKGTSKLSSEENLKNQRIELRELPVGIDFKSSLWIIRDQLILFSGHYPFIVSVRHSLICNSMKSIFEYFWNLEDPLKK